MLKSFSDMPGPWGLPFIGSLGHLTCHKEKVLMQWAEENYGPVFRLRLGDRQAISLQGWDAVKEALEGKAVSFSGRVESIVLTSSRDNKGLFFIDYGKSWKTWHEFATIEFGKVWKTSLEGILEETQHLTAFLTDKVGKPVSLLEPMKLTMMNGVIQTCFSRRLEIPHYRELYENVYGTTQSKKFGQLLLLPWLRYVPSYKKFLDESVQSRKRIIDMIGSLIQERRAEERPTPDLIQQFDQLSSKNCEKPAFNEENLKVFIEDLLFAGTATTANQFLWIILFLLKHPACLKRLQNEIDSSFTADTNPVDVVIGDSASEMNYLKAVVQETFRLRPIAPTSLMHKTSENTSVMGYEVPKGTTVIPNIWSIHHDKIYWKPDPEVFRPERHLSESGKFLKSERVVNFSSGWRRCVGERLAETEIKVHLLTLLAHFDIALAEESKDVDINGVSEAILKPCPFQVVLQKRKQCN